MSNEPPTYSALSMDEQAKLSVWIESFEERFPQEGVARLKQTLDDAPDRLRSALLSQLLPLLIDDHRQRHSVTPTLHELRLAHPDLTENLADAYALLPPDYRLPVELRGYRVLRVVGEGGQAVVLKAQDDVHSAVAIKLSVSPQHNELLLRERRLLAECHHPGIPEVIASGINEERAFYIMPFLRGKTLADRYATFRPDPTEAARIVGDLCSIVAHLHSQGILHRDIKPANVWLDDQGAVKLIDLGMALERTSWGKPLSEIREFHGTPAFMSPEQATADGERDGELSDIFSIGATLYWLGTGSAPFDGDSGKSVLGKAAAGQFDRDRLAVAAGWPKPLINACLRAMATELPERYRSASGLRDALTAIQPDNRPSRWKYAMIPLLVLMLACVSLATTTRYPRQLWSLLTIDEKAGDSSEQALNRSDEPTTKLLKPLAVVDPDREGVVSGPWREQQTVGPESVTKPILEEPGRPALPPEPTPAERVVRAKAWLKKLPEGTQLGQFVGRRFHPTTLAPIRDAITSIRISSGDVRNGDRTILLGDKPDEFWDMPPERLRDNLLRPLRGTDSSEYAYDSQSGVVAEPVESPFIEIRPGVNYFYLAVYFLDGSFIDHQLVSNLDQGFAIDIDGHHPRSRRAKLFLFREKTIGTDTIATYLKEPMSPLDPNRDYLYRTRVGFYCPKIPRYPCRAASTSAESVQPPERIGPGTIYVHHFTSAGRRTKVVRYEVTRVKLVELAESAVYFERELRTQYFNADGSKRNL